MKKVELTKRVRTTSDDHGDQIMTCDCGRELGRNGQLIAKMSDRGIARCPDCKGIIGRTKLVVVSVSVSNG